MFFQLGMLDALYDSATNPHRKLQGDLVIINRQVKTLIDMSSFPRTRIQQTLAYDGIASADPVYVDFANWRNPDTHLEKSILVFGFDPLNSAFDMSIVYQILYSNVSEHLPEYATLKAIRYSDRYLLNMLMQEALILAALGFIPGFLVSIGLYQISYAATLLEIAMKGSRSAMVLFLTILMCGTSGAIAMRKLRSADPADIF